MNKMMKYDNKKIKVEETQVLRRQLMILWVWEKRIKLWLKITINWLNWIVSVALMCFNNSSNYNRNNNRVSNIRVSNNNKMMGSNSYLNSHKLNKCDIK